ncbi:MAG: putative virulence factor [Prevotella sp.]|nr:putative virulence factor [Prevotella sp.]
MIDDKLKQIENINESLAWIKSHRPEQYERRFLQLVDERRKLRKIVEAEKDNPAMAAYGKSQVGKSYLMSNMLQRQVTGSNGRKEVLPFEVEDEEKKYNFINEMNPITHDTEATGVVTRFSSFSRNPDRHCRKYPILMKSLTVMDVTLILCDGYYNDMEDSETLDRVKINEIADGIYEKYIHHERPSKAPMVADDVLEIKEYFRQHILKAQEFRNSDFFDKVALIIDNVPVEDYADIFSLLWTKPGETNDYLTPLYRRLLGAMSRLQFRSDIYLGADAVLHEGKNENTIMSVQCLNGLGETDSSYRCDAHLKQTDGTFLTVPQMQKSELSALCSEIVVLIGPDFLQSSASYDMSDISDQHVRSQLTKGEIRLDLLKDTDLLDFPGARSRKKEYMRSLEQPKVLTTILLRGKVAYLFNKYSESKVVNILMFCQDNTQSDVNTIPATLKEWVEQYVGATPDERARTLQLTGGISPLFFVATKFNITMAEDQNPKGNEYTSLLGRWEERFSKVLYKECFNADGAMGQWAKNWTRQGEFFQNSYLLRDFKYSGMKGSKIYDGFRERGQEDKLLVERSYLDLLRKSFCESKDAEQFFTDRELVWDAAATMNNDGALFIIEKLAKVAAAMERTRQTQFDDECRKVMANVLNIMKGYYVSDDTGELLNENINKAYGIYREIDLTCDNRPEMFGHMLEALQINEVDSLKRLHNVIPRLNAMVHGNEKQKDYELIRKSCNNFEGCKTEAEKWDVLLKRYRFRSQDEATAFLRRKGVDPQKLFAADTVKHKNSAVIADDMMSFWTERIQGPMFMNTFGDDIDTIALNDLVSCLIATAQSVKLAETLERQIAQYVDVLNTSMINQAFVADMIATTVSDFVINFGYNYLTGEQVAAARRVAAEENLSPCFEEIDTQRKECYDNDEMTELFKRILDSDRDITESYTSNLHCWFEYMFVAFIAHLNVPDYDRAANEQLKAILDNMKA